VIADIARDREGRIFTTEARRRGEKQDRSGRELTRKARMGEKGGWAMEAGYLLIRLQFVVKRL
jgi:hypothetical protein